MKMSSGSVVKVYPESGGDCEYHIGFRDKVAFVKIDSLSFIIR